MTLSRSRYLNLISRAVDAGEIHFARQAALPWLAAYPGDLEAGLYYARALLADNRAQTALGILQGICQADPEYSSAAVARLQAETLVNGAPSVDSLTAVTVLAEQITDLGWQTHLPSWALYLRQAYLLMMRDEVDESIDSLHPALAAGPAIPLAAVLHLRLLDRSNSPLPARLNLAEFYRQRWPSCVALNLLLADWLMDSGDESRAVSLLHQAAVRDVGGQVAERLWGVNHPYSGLWPTNLELSLDIPIPAAVATRVGMNLLDGSKESILYSPGQAAGMMADQKSKKPTRRGGIDIHELLAGTTGSSQAATVLVDRPSTLSSNTPVSEQSLELEAELSELNKLANRLNQPEVTKTDGRFPVYVVLTTRRGLESIYGPSGTSFVEDAVNDLVVAASTRPHWGSRLFVPDEVENITSLGIQPARSDDPWSIKLALTDLDRALGQRGERIGALLIVGGPEVVPFHRLPNPVDDDDQEVLSDNPYATRDENYFAPEWPVGRLPGGAGKDPALLIYLLNQVARSHREHSQPLVWYKRLWQRFLAFFGTGPQGDRSSFGYTAEVWKRASQTVFQSIGGSQTFWVSPPHRSPAPSSNGARPTLSLPLARLGYFNLHGLVDASEWYGQSDPQGEPDQPEYPIALRTEDLDKMNGSTPRVVFSEACYGAHVNGRSLKGSLALKFLSSGTRAFVGSTGMAYGSIDRPLIAADLLGQNFWQGIREGMPSGEALRRAKIAVVREMQNRQGYLDGEDQKTLISFVHYGDPLAQVFSHPNGSYKAKSVLRPPVEVKTICDRALVPLEQEQSENTLETLEYVRHVVARYLPGMEDAKFNISQEHAHCADGHCCPNSQIKSISHPEYDPGRRVIVLNKRIPNTTRVHSRYARLTLDSKGKLVKLVVSR